MARGWGGLGARGGACLVSALTHSHSFLPLPATLPPPPHPLRCAAVMACLRKVLSALPAQAQSDLAYKAPSAVLRAAVMAALTPVA